MPIQQEDARLAVTLAAELSEALSNEREIVALELAALELGRYAFWAISVWLLPGVDKVEPSLSLTAWFSVLVVFVLAEVFREGARLRREAELTI